jgi:SAM-dependent methyltransferase
MPSIEWNEQMWGTAHPWAARGSEWSVTWGDVETHWVATILPRIHKFLPAQTVLEIAPGFGRWTGYFLPLCDTYIGVDLAEACVKACTERFASAENATFFVNDGKSLPTIADGSIDFVFSFDSLVHAEADVVDAYLSELSRVLTPDGIGFLHHSNLGSKLSGLVLCRLLERVVRRIPFIFQRLARWGIVDWDHARAKSMTANRFATTCQKAGLACVGQEIIAWGQGRKMIDCLSLVARPGSRWHRPNVVVSNADFMGEAFSAHRIASVYSSLRARDGASPWFAGKLSR